MLHKATLERIRGEFLEMPGLRLTLAQAQRLCGVERALCQAILDALVDAKFLCLKADGAYARVSDGEFRHSRAGKVNSRTGKHSASRTLNQN